MDLIILESERIVLRTENVCECDYEVGHLNHKIRCKHWAIGGILFLLFCFPRWGLGMLTRQVLNSWLK